MPDVSYTRVNWEDSPSTNTPINAANLNVMDKGISDCALEISNRQPKTDNNLDTTNKTITGAINEINASLSSLTEQKGSKAGAGSTTVSLDISQYKKILCIAKKSGVIIAEKIIPTSLLATNDIIPLGYVAPVIGTSTPLYSGKPEDTNMTNGTQLGVYSGTARSLFYNSSGTSAASDKSWGLAADISKNTNVKITYNGNNSFTLTSVSGVTVYLYA